MDTMQTDQNAPALNAQEAVATATVTVIRAGTGKVEHFDLTFTPEAPKTPELPKEAE